MNIPNGDKILHIIVNFIIVLIIGLIFNPLAGVISSLIISISKELYDMLRSNGTGWSWDDLCADIIGILLGLFVIL